LNVVTTGQIDNGQLDNGQLDNGQIAKGQKNLRYFTLGNGIFEIKKLLINNFKK